jgi:methionyl-tRNA synthetase
MDIRVASILHAERVPKTDKLVKLELDTGIDKRTVVSGIAEYFKAEDLVGKQVSLLANLAPRKIRGIESHGMILLAEEADGKLVFIIPEEGSREGAAIK